jgi:hypothetical protein
MTYTLEIYFRSGEYVAQTFDENPSDKLELLRHNPFVWEARVKQS